MVTRASSTAPAPSASPTRGTEPAAGPARSPRVETRELIAGPEPSVREPGRRARRRVDPVDGRRVHHRAAVRRPSRGVEPQLRACRRHHEPHRRPATGRRQDLRPASERTHIVVDVFGGFGVPGLAHELEVGRYEVFPSSAPIGRLIAYCPSLTANRISVHVAGCHERS